MSDSEESIHSKTVQLPETGKIEVRRRLDGSDEPIKQAYNLEPGERFEIEGPDGFVLAYEVSPAAEPEEGE